MIACVPSVLPVSTITHSSTIGRTRSNVSRRIAASFLTIITNEIKGLPYSSRALRLLTPPVGRARPLEDAARILHAVPIEHTPLGEEIPLDLVDDLFVAPTPLFSCGSRREGPDPSRNPPRPNLDAVTRVDRGARIREIHVGSDVADLVAIYQHEVARHPAGVTLFDDHPAPAARAATVRSREVCDPDRRWRRCEHPAHRCRTMARTQSPRTSPPRNSMSSSRKTQYRAFRPLQRPPQPFHVRD